MMIALMSIVRVLMVFDMFDVLMVSTTASIDAMMALR
jgi:hypothetical protein